MLHSNFFWNHLLCTNEFTLQKILANQDLITWILLFRRLFRLALHILGPKRKTGNAGPGNVTIRRKAEDTTYRVTAFFIIIFCFLHFYLYVKSNEFAYLHFWFHYERLVFTFTQGVSLFTSHWYVTSLLFVGPPGITVLPPWAWMYHKAFVQVETRQ